MYSQSSEKNSMNSQHDAVAEVTAKVCMESVRHQLDDCVDAEGCHACRSSFFVQARRSLSSSRPSVVDVFLFIPLGISSFPNSFFYFFYFMRFFSHIRGSSC